MAILWWTVGGGLWVVSLHCGSSPSSPPDSNDITRTRWQHLNQFLFLYTKHINSGKLRTTVDSLRFPLVDALINIRMMSETGTLANMYGSIVICKWRMKSQWKGEGLQNFILWTLRIWCDQWWWRRSEQVQTAATWFVSSHLLLPLLTSLFFHLLSFTFLPLSPPSVCVWSCWLSRME